MLNFSRLKKDKKEANMGSIFLKQFIGFLPTTHVMILFSLCPLHYKKYFSLLLILFKMESTGEKGDDTKVLSKSSTLKRKSTQDTSKSTTVKKMKQDVQQVTVFNFAFKNTQRMLKNRKSRNQIHVYRFSNKTEFSNTCDMMLFIIIIIKLLYTVSIFTVLICVDFFM